MKWWEDTSIYQIYPKSFQDSDGDGIGDIRGIIQRLDYLKDLGVETLWLNPMYVSPQVDNGYDVTDYYALDPLFGTMEDLEILIDEAHQRGMKLLFDFVLNHTSVTHQWFEEARQSIDNKYREYYIWKEPKEDGRPPTNWGSFFGGSAWKYDKQTDMYYFHLFDEAMPDLNWDNPEVRQAMVDIGLFWLSKGIDGFRLDAFIHMEKDTRWLDVAAVDGVEFPIAEEYYANLPKVFTYMHEFSEKLRAEYPDVFLLGEAASAQIEDAKKYTEGPLRSCDAVVTFRYFTEDASFENKRIPRNIQQLPYDIKQFKCTMRQWQQELKHPTLYWNNHDMPRMISRYNVPEDKRGDFAKTYAAAMFLQKGIPIIYYGEEIGMKNVPLLECHALEQELVKDFYASAVEMGLQLGSERAEIQQAIDLDVKVSRRGVMQWDETQYAGFSLAEPWSGVNNEKNWTVESQQNTDESVLLFYQELLALKKSSLFAQGSYEYIETNVENVYAYQRVLHEEQATVIINLGNGEERIKNRWNTNTIMKTIGNIQVEEEVIFLPGYSTIILQK